MGMVKPDTQGPSPAAAEQPRRPLFFTLLAVALVFLVGGSLVQILYGTSAGGGAWHAWGTDDAYITYRYAQNLATGNGLVFNAGERVEGYSSLLHVVLLVPVYLLTGAQHIYAGAAALNLFCMVLAFILFTLHVRRTRGPDQAVLAALLFGASPLLWLVVAMGMETPVVMLIQIVFWIQMENMTGRGRDGAGLEAAWPGAGGWWVRHGFLVSILLLLAARADGFLMPAAGALYLFLAGRRRQAAQAAAVMAGGMAVVTGWRLFYYGFPFPNTYYVKVSGPLAERWWSGALLLRDILMDGGLGFYLLAFLFAWVVSLAAWKTMGNGREGEQGRWPLPGFGAFFGIPFLLYFIHVGGDVYRERFLVVLIPLGIACLLAYLGPRMKQAALIFVVLLAFLVQLRPLALDQRFVYIRDKYDAWVTLGEFLRLEHPDDFLAVDAAGKIPFYSGLRTIDMLGLADATIAHQEASFFRVGHNKSDVEYVLSREPDLIAVMSEDLDMNYRWGLKRDRYREAGYSLRYVVNCEFTSRGRRDVLDVAGKTPDEIQALVMRGYRYGVLQRQSGQSR
jgi:arabinofuranosyltransferase